jgi:polyphosphate kinase
LVVRDDPDGIRRYVHVGTGNYNATTAKLYDDLGLFTTDEDLGADLSHLFNYLTGYGRNVKYEKLLVAPYSLRHRIKDLILAEAGAAKSAPGSGRVRMKLNSLVDPDMIEALYAASQSGVQIDCIVRGICCLRPGVPGMSENIRVRSIVGRYLEHSRIYEFANGAGQGHAAFYIGSADLMPRNLDRRVEALTPVNDPDLQDRLREILAVDLADDVLAWTLGPDGTWRKVPTADDGTSVDTHLKLQELAASRGRWSGT